MLGTGIASAHEDVNPDRAVNPLDGSVSVPVQFKDNAIGTPLGQLNMPNVDRKISSDTITDKLPGPLKGAASKVAAPLTHAATTQASAAKQRLGLPADPADGNRLHGHLAVPVQVAGNAVAIGGPAKVHTNAKQDFNRPAAERTSAHGNSLGGNVVGGDAALPIQLANNAVGAGANASSSGTASQHTSVGGPVTTDGSGAPLAGNTALAHLATPIQLTGNAIAGGGHAEAASQAESTAAAGGAIKTSGRGGVVSGNAAGAPVALPAEANGNALALGGIAGSASTSKAGAVAGGTNSDSVGNPFYTLTNGDSATVSGNTAQPELAGPVMFSGNAGNLAGNTAAVGTTASTAKAGGGAGTSGRGATLSGNIANGPAAYPVQVFGDAATLGGNASAAHRNTVSSQAGGSNATFGGTAARPLQDLLPTQASAIGGGGSTLSSNDAVPALAGSGDVFGSGASLVGNANGVGQNNTKAKSGGYLGTTGDNSAGSGNIAHAPVALPMEVFGVGGTLGGNASGTADNVKEITPGGPPNSEDDGGTAASNIAYLPVSTPVELFGSAAHLGGNSHGVATNDLKSNAGGKAHATGTAGTIAGNIVQGPISGPVQGFGDTAGLVGNGAASGANKTASNAAGPASTDGTHGSLAGNVVNVAGGGAGQLFGNTVGGVGNYTGAGANNTTSTAGGDVRTNGDNGSGSGNVLSGDALPIAQGFGAGASALANGAANGSNKSTASSGGDIATSGRNAAVSGNLLDVPAAALAQPFGVAGAVGGNQTSNGDNTLTGVVGGDRSTAGRNGSLSGLKGVPRVGVNGQLYRIPVEIVGNALSTASNRTAVDVAGDEPQINLPGNGSELPISKLPTLHNLPVPQNLPTVRKLPGLPSHRTVPTQSAAPRTMPGAAGLTDVLPTVSRTATGAVHQAVAVLDNVPGPRGGSRLPVTQGSGFPGITNGLPGMRTIKGAQDGFAPLSGVLNTDQLLRMLGSTPPSAKDRPMPVTRSAGRHAVRPMPAVVSGDLPVLEQVPQTGNLISANHLLNLGGGEVHTLPYHPAMPGLDTADLTGLFTGRLPRI